LVKPSLAQVLATDCALVLDYHASETTVFLNGKYSNITYISKI